jgi:RNA polymerase sigma factor (sigma-70 family)
MNIENRRTNVREIFAGLYDEHMSKVYRYIFYKVNDHQLAEDLTSNVFEKALIKFSQYDESRASFLTWVFAITRTTISDYYRAQPKVNTTLIDEALEMPGRDPLPDEIVEEGEERQLLRKCIGVLPEDEQEIVRLKFALEMTNRNIAKQIGLTESNVGVKLYRIIRKLRDSFQELPS